MSAILTLQAGDASFEGSVDPLLGIIAIRLKCHAPDLLSAITGTLPEIGVTGLVENQPRRFTRDPAGDVGGYHVDVTLEGHLDPAGAAGEEFSLDGSTSDDPIETHPELLLLLDEYEGEEDEQGRAHWPTTLSDETGEAARNPMHGVESYLVPGLIWTRRYVSPTLPASVTQTLGTFDQPPGNPPPLSGRRQWFKIRARAQWRGNVWEIEESWQLTGPYGVAPELYRRRS